ncbi:MAG: DUF6285 domain-containing protein [Pseudomonadota bacterium]
MADQRPTAAELIAAVADFLERKAAPQLDAHTAFHAKVAVNALRIVERELLAGPDHAALGRLRALCTPADPAADAGSLNRELKARIADGRIDTGDAALLDHLLKDVLTRIAVDSPKYPSLKNV